MTLLVPLPQGGRSTVTTTAVEVRGRKSAMPLGAGKVVRSITRHRRRVTFPPVLLVTVLRISKVPKVELFGGSFVPLTVIHGDAEIFAYRFGSCAYLTDFSSIPEDTFAQLENLDLLFLDGLRHTPHPTHSTVENSLKIVDRVKPQRAFFTHIAHDLPHKATNDSLPPNVQLCYDGMKLEFEI